MAKAKVKIEDINIDDLDIEAIEEEVTIEEVEVIEDVKESAKAKDVIAAIKKNAPEFPVWDNMTALELDTIFGLGDQGRTVRRYLRKYFSDNHIHKESWKLTKSEANDVVAYLATKFGAPRFESKKEEEA